MRGDLEFLEKQYFGLNKTSLTRRMVLSILCFFTYYWCIHNGKSGDLYFFIGISIIVFSILLFFILHFKTQVTNNSIILDGLWTARRVKININNIISVNKIKYSNYLFNHAVYNLHVKGKIHFYTRGAHALELIDKDGLTYLIGSQKADELEKIIKKNLN